jgi:hypothetical protein
VAFRRVFPQGRCFAGSRIAYDNGNVRLVLITALRTESSADVSAVGTSSLAIRRSSRFNHAAAASSKACRCTSGFSPDE